MCLARLQARHVLPAPGPGSPAWEGPPSGGTRDGCRELMGPPGRRVAPREQSVQPPGPDSALRVLGALMAPTPLGPFRAASQGTSFPQSSRSGIWKFR